jgi:hypothetical protein
MATSDQLTLHQLVAVIAVHCVDLVNAEKHPTKEGYQTSLEQKLRDRKIPDPKGLAEVLTEDAEQCFSVYT